jgi:hypothetical protein
MSYDTYIAKQGEAVYGEPDYTAIEWEEASFGLSTTEAWEQVVQNGLVANKVYNKAIDDLADGTTLGEPTEAQAKNLLMELDWLVREFIAIAPTATLVEFTATDVEVMANQYKRGGIAKVLTSMLNTDGDWPSADTQFENLRGCGDE